jgi:hypothetical protein
MGAPTALPALSFADLEAELNRERGLRAKLRSLPVLTQRALVIGLGVAIGSLMWVLAKDVAAERALVTLGSLSTVCLMALWHALRPIHQPPLPAWAWGGLLLLGIAVPVGVAFLPPLALGPGEPPALKCFGLGTLMGLPVLLLALVVDRAPRVAALGSGTLLAAVAAGGLGNVCLEGHCASDGTVHRLVGHALIGVCLLAAAYALSRLRVPRSP